MENDSEDILKIEAGFQRFDNRSVGVLKFNWPEKMKKNKQKPPRKGWAKLFKKMHQQGDNELLIPDLYEDEKFLNDPKEWVWPVDSKK
ncbi:hypothetical protein GCM10009119_08360 [Algoriphagus jejuensis]|uniref:Uncharacterized protein n=2 Tax=Algoriphagus jejuensis TaxID=419934 RepID=A0ABP3YB89_9BACT